MNFLWHHISVVQISSSFYISSCDSQLKITPKDPHYFPLCNGNINYHRWRWHSNCQHVTNHQLQQVLRWVCCPGGSRPIYKIGFLTRRISALFPVISSQPGYNHESSATRHGAQSSHISRILITVFPVPGKLEPPFSFSSTSPDCFICWKLNMHI